MKTVPRLKKRQRCDRDDVPSRNDDKLLHPPAIVVIVHACEKSLMATFAEIYYSPQKNGGVEIHHVCQG